MITFQCLECDEDLHIDESAALGQKVSCIYCGSEFEVVAVDPIEVDWADEDETDELDLVEDDLADDDPGTSAISDALLNDDLIDTTSPLAAMAVPTPGRSGSRGRPAVAKDIDEDIITELPEDDELVDEKPDAELEDDELEDDELDDDEVDDWEDDDELDDWEDDEELDDDEWEWDDDDDDNDDRWN